MTYSERLRRGKRLVDDTLKVRKGKAGADSRYGKDQRIADSLNPASRPVYHHPTESPATTLGGGVWRIAMLEGCEERALDIFIAVVGLVGGLVVGAVVICVELLK